MNDRGLKPSTCAHNDRCKTLFHEFLATSQQFVPYVTTVRPSPQKEQRAKSECSDMRYTNNACLHTIQYLQLKCSWWDFTQYTIFERYRIHQEAADTTDEYCLRLLVSDKDARTYRGVSFDITALNDSDPEQSYIHDFRHPSG